MAATEVALITGASTGIGRATVRALAKKGFRVFATARRDESVRELRTEGRDLGYEALELDVERDESVDAAIKHILAEAGSIDVLVNNAGYGLIAPVEAVTPEMLRQQFETNVIGAHRMVRAVLPAMRARGRGTIVQISSVVGLVAMPLYGAYSASKFALEALSDSLRLEVASFGIRVVLIEPGPIRTEFSSTSHKISDPLLESERSLPYAGIIKKTQEARARSRKMAGLGPAVVADTIVRAIESRSPATRYPITPLAHVVPGLQAVLPDKVFDRLLRMTMGK